MRIRLVSARGRPLQALAAAAPLLGDASVREQAQLQTAAAAAEALVSCGRIGEAVALTKTWQPVAWRHRHELPLAEPLLIDLRAFALRFAGRLLEATELALQTYTRALTWQSTQMTAVEAAALGFIWLARGSVRTALRLFRESAALLRDADAVGMLAWALSPSSGWRGPGARPQTASCPGRARRARHSASVVAPPGASLIFR